MMDLFIPQVLAVITTAFIAFLIFFMPYPIAHPNITADIITATISVFVAMIYYYGIGSFMDDLLVVPKPLQSEWLPAKKVCLALVIQFIVVVFAMKLTQFLMR